MPALPGRTRSPMRVQRAGCTRRHAHAAPRERRPARPGPGL
jgi:hypothetical protein